MHTEATDVAVLLVAGVGDRLRPLTDGCPKALLDVGGETMLGRAVRLLLAAGVHEFVVATGYRQEAVRRALASCPARVRFCPNPAFDKTQNSVSLLRCRDAVGGRAFYKLDGDLLFHADVLARVSAVRAPLVAAIDRGVVLGAEEMKVRVEGERIVAFGKALTPATSHGESIGIERLSSAGAAWVFDGLERAAQAGRTGLYYEDVYAELIHDGLEARTADVTGLPWAEVDTPADLEKARHLVRSGALDRASAPHDKAAN